MPDNRPSPEASRPRIPWIDVLRGIAIVIMILANFSPYLLIPHPTWLRIVGSYAAPAFIMLSAGMVILRAKKHDLSYYIIRGALIAGFAALIDIFIWLQFPFTSFDVLNLIGLALPLIYIARNCSSVQLLCIGSVFFVMTPILQMLFGYHRDILEIPFGHASWPGLVRIITSWFIDGWFPIFPWLGYAFVGAAFFRTVFAKPNYSLARASLLFGIPATALGFFLLFVPATFLTNVADGGILEERLGYSEFFYPPTIPYIISSLGVVVLMAWVAQQIRQLAMSRLLHLLGQYSLFIYILHQFMGKYILFALIKYFGYSAIPTQEIFLAVVLLEIGFAYLCCKIIERIKISHPPKFLVWQMLFAK